MQSERNALSRFRWVIRDPNGMSTIGPRFNSVGAVSVAGRAGAGSEDGHRREHEGSQERGIDDKHSREGGAVHAKFAVQFVAGHDGLLMLTLPVRQGVLLMVPT